MFLTTLPSLSNTPVFIVSKWTNLWPITYYAIGAYIAKYGINISLKKLVVIFIFSYLLFSSVNVLIVHNHLWKKLHSLDSWGGIENVIDSVLFFLILQKINFNKLNQRVKNFITSIAKLSLGIYLSSYLFDNIVYHYFNQYVISTTAKLGWFIIIVPIVFICSTIMAKIADIIQKLIMQIIQRREVS